MQWTMPPRVLQIVAGLIGLAAAASFAVGIISAPQRGARLPGERVPGATGPATAIDATDATPLNDERIQGAPPPAADDTANDEDKQSEADAGNSDSEDAAAAAPAANAGTTQTAQARPAPKPAPPAPDAGGQTLGGPPASDEPPH